MSDARIQKMALYHAKFADPLDPDMGWRREDIQLAFMAGAREQPVRRLLTMREVAEILATSVSTIRDLVLHGELAYVKVGRGTERNHMAFAPEEVESFIKRHTQRDYLVSAPKTSRYGTRKRAHELAVERAASDEGSFMAQYEARRAAAKAKKK
ncbi:helix-turn-helix domain-containing protein [Rhizobium laguerreae]|uniref:helix-turn-helix domain-containing protein n=1 Tax=Rhizobium laguerreae TaxID=1076926 RepID=UPI001C90CC27|nr:helix-turn-helix domain-containing protein [Rhizobium laguerreae]MBY3255606.1 helix-turn-helix domain-containing protein [Rhizobium laguerreae]MBY3282645.1 helix-turn-helix domain-containing protein [Rhizobium laguerreae]MBY3288999.1 helix-turn-helix domain-containing protein [Rhizobium laguerreae]